MNSRQNLDTPPDQRMLLQEIHSGNTPAFMQLGSRGGSDLQENLTPYGGGRSLQAHHSEGLHRCAYSSGGLDSGSSESQQPLRRHA